MPWMTQKHDDGKVCVHKQNADESLGEEVICYTGDDAESKAKEKIKALYASENEDNQSEMQSMFSFAELSASVISPDGKFIDGVAPGTFIDMYGKKVTIPQADLNAYIKNTQRVLDSTKDSSGAIVGLPIDKADHDHQGGAGWIVGLELDKTRNIIKFLVKWTKEGAELIRGNIKRFFSPSLHLGQKIILGGSLTNDPATRSKDGLMILRPVELSAHLKEIHMNKTIDEILAEKDAAHKQEVDTLRAQLQAAKKTEDEEIDLSPEAIASFLNSSTGVDELSKLATKKAEQVIHLEKRKTKIAEFASMIRGGTPQKPYGLPIKTHKLISLLLRIPAKESDEVMELITSVWKLSIDFQAHGFNGELVSGKRLDPEFAILARKWVGSGKTIHDFFKVNADVLGDIAEYNISEFVKEN
jgi:phage I-like protein